MLFRFAPVIALLAAVATAQDLTVNTPPSVEQCLPSLISWSGGTGPYFVSVRPGGQPSASPIVDFGSQSGTSLTWTVNVPAGQSIGFQVRDQTGTIQNSAPVTVGGGDDSSCIGQSASVGSGSTTTAVTAGSVTGSATGSSSSGSASSTSSRSSGSTSGSGSAASASSTGSDSAAMPFAKISSAGVIGAFVAAIFA